ncbi:hypothetical protein LOTGIDRAFT_171074 [Lottia gigantea]|uniref:Uncharacterized protein n=1 Tax=Lottia gigantea TaxID=225164 RepID=V4BEA2_LOTGI|nr:hypothetical protein LOTGIDRAFT_171074 [Lottia gigantea]ESP04102.1 hypothetical protein LOTGIDRAFT_171074 [Lottia gigantea]
MWKDNSSKTTKVSYPVYWKVDSQNCETCQKDEQHELSAEKARRAFQADASDKCPDIIIFAADMQCVILLPKLTTTEHQFESRLVVFNETFASLTEKGDSVILFHEAIAGLHLVEIRW